MGYTHYWRASKADKYLKAYAIAKKIAQRGVEDGVLAGWDGTGEAVITDEEIRFNGRGEDGHETFVLPGRLEGVPDFSFCKTARKPYDKYVTAILAAMEDVIVVSSDGEMNGEEWQEGRDLLEEIAPGFYL